MSSTRAEDPGDPEPNSEPNSEPVRRDDRQTASWILDSGTRGALRHLTDSPAPKSIGPYEVIGTLGEGGMGSVYLARQDRPIRRRVALKLIRHGLDSREVIARFESERQALAVMNHPGIARVYDAGTTDDGQPYFAMELVEDGAPITEYCDARRLSVEERLRMFIDVCRAVQHAHQNAIIHRDLKPSNVLVSDLDDKPLPRVIDFGIARAVDPEQVRATVVTETGGIIGTPGYMSPEQTDAGNSVIDTRTDVYSLGAMLYELLVGTIPILPETLKSGNLVDIVLEIRERDPQRPSTRLASSGEGAMSIAANRGEEIVSLRRKLRGDLDWVTMRALEKDPARRYESPGELARDIERFLAFEPVRARPPSIAYRLRKFARRNRWQLLTAAAAAALLLTAAVWSIVSSIATSRELSTEGEELWSRHEALDARDLRGEWLALHRGTESWVPIWERAGELAAWEEWRRQGDVLSGLMDQAREKFRLAAEVAPAFSAERRRATKASASIDRELLRRTSRGEPITLGPEHFRRALEASGLPEFQRLASGDGELALELSPAPASVHLYRIEPRDGRLLPLAYDARSGTTAAPFLRVWKVKPGHEPFRARDRLVSLRVSGDPSPIRSRTDLARALREVAADQEVEVTLLRGGDALSVSWTPFPSTRLGGPFTAGRLLDPLAQFDMLFEGYPLETLDACRLEPGRSGGGSYRATLPPGSYLLLLRRPGSPDTRVPFTIASASETALRVRLFPDEDVPDGFVHVPAGRFPFGGDAPAYRSAERGDAHVDDFFMSRTEVTYGEYLEFVNAPETLARLALSRRQFEEAAAEIPEAERERAKFLAWRSVPLSVDRSHAGVKRVTANLDSVQILPVVSIDTIVQRDPADLSKGFELNPQLSQINARSPALGVPVVAALEYAKWLSERPGPRWRFRLPRDLEWEKAARGADRRIYVWGDYPLFALANTDFGIYPGEDPDADIDDVGVHPADESVYAILDMAGCTKEPVLNAIDEPRVPSPKERFCTLRGAAWDTTDERDPRIATRNRRVAYHSIRFVGFRLVADPP